MRKVLMLCLAICFVFALTSFAFDDMGKSTTVNGWITDAKCGAKGANAAGEVGEAGPRNDVSGYRYSPGKYWCLSRATKVYRGRTVSDCAGGRDERYPPCTGFYDKFAVELRAGSCVA